MCMSVNVAYICITVLLWQSKNNFGCQSLLSTCLKQVLCSLLPISGYQTHKFLLFCFSSCCMHTEITYGCYCILFYMSSGDLDSGVHTYMACASAIEPSAQLCLLVPNWKATLVFIKFCFLKCLAYDSVNFESHITWHGWCIKSAAILNQLNCWWSKWTHWLCHCLFHS